MRWLFTAAVLALVLPDGWPQLGAEPTPGREPPLLVLRAALRAVERDSSPALVTAWRSRVARDSTDRAAVLDLARAAQLTYDYPAAQALYDRLTARDTVSPDAYAAYARVGVAEILINQRGAPDVLAELGRARAVARRIGDLVAEGVVLTRSATSVAQTRGIPAGLAVLDSASRLLPADAPDLRAELLAIRGRVLAVAARPEALAVADSALVLARRAGVRRLEAEAVRDRALYYFDIARTDSALVLFERAESLFRRARARDRAGRMMMSRVGVLRDLGELGAARALLAAGRVEGEASHENEVVTASFTGLGAIDLQLNDFSAATEQLTAALHRYIAAGDSSGSATTRYWLGLARLGAGDTASALADVGAAARYYRTFGDWEAFIETQEAVATILMRERDLAGASRVLAGIDSLARRERKPRWLTGIHYDEGRVALLRGDFTHAAALFRQRLAALDTAQHLARYTTRLRLAEADARRGDIAAAEREATAAAAELDRWRATLKAPELRVYAFQASGDERDGRDASLAHVLAALAARGRAPQAFALAERGRARELAEAMARAAALRAASTGGQAVAGAAPAGESDVRAAIPDARTAVLEYLVGPERAPTTLFVLTRAATTAVALAPADSLANEVHRFVALLEGGADPRALARELGRTLLDSALSLLPPSVDRLVVVPDGELHHVPFDALRLSDGRLVVERFTTSVAPSASVAVSLWRAPRAPLSRPARILAFGDPAFAAETRGTGDDYRSAFARTGGLPRLVASGREARMVARFSPDAEVRLRERATAAYLKHAPLADFQVIHLATHALTDEQSAARSALALAPSEGDDGFVGAGDLAALHLTADLVVLSACRSGGGVIVGGEGVQGLTAPLLQAGARAIVASSWRVGDRSVLHLVEDFYGALARGLTVADALRAAKLGAVRRGAPASEWAAFTAMGDPTIRVPVRAPRDDATRTIAAVALAVLLVLLGVAYGVRTRRIRAAERRSVPSSI